MFCPAGALTVSGRPKCDTSTKAAHPIYCPQPLLPTWLGTKGCSDVQCLFSTQQLFYNVRRGPVGMLRGADKLQAINASFLIPIFPQGNPEQDTNILSDFTSFPFCFFQHNHIHRFLLLCRSCLQLEAQNTIYFLYGFLIWKWI